MQAVLTLPTKGHNVETEKISTAGNGWGVWSKNNITIHLIAITFHNLSCKLYSHCAFFWYKLLIYHIANKNSRCNVSPKLEPHEVILPIIIAI